MSEFGKEIMKEEFILNSDYTFINHGSFGTAPRKVSEYKQRLIQVLEEEPEIWFGKKVNDNWNENIKAVCDFVKSPIKNLVLVSNTTCGINSILRSLKFQKGDFILINTWTYRAMKSLSSFVSYFSEGEVLVESLDMPYPLNTEEQLIECYEHKLIENPHIKLVLLDYISSMPPALFPLEKLTALFKKHDILILIDGAHTPGHIKLDLKNMGCHFFVGNLHKWAYASIGCALMWVCDEFVNKIFPSVITNMNPYIKKRTINQSFMYQDSENSSLYTAIEAIKFYQDIGGYEKIYDYCFDLINKAAELLVQKWSTEEFPLPRSMKSPFMRLIRIPNLKKFCVSKPSEEFNIDLAELMAYLWKRYKIQSCFQYLYDTMWCRISVNVYNCLNDYEKLADAILELYFEENNKN